MTKSKIGLKLANGEFYPVLQDAVAARKRLVVTTVQDDQQSVQIDLYRGSGTSVSGAEYIGSLVIEGIPPKPKGEPDIRMEIGLADDGTLTARAEEASTHASQSLKVSLKSLSEEQKYEIPDFEFSQDEEEGTEKVESFGDEDFAGTDSLPGAEEPASLLERAQTAAPEARRRPLFIALIILAGLILILGLAYLLYRCSTGTPKAAEATPAATTQPAPAPAAAAQAPTQPAPAVPPPAPPEPQAAPKAEPPAPPPPAPAAPAPAPKPKKAAATPAAKTPGVWYKIKWGDTLWNLSYAFYRNPWYFGKIAKANKIRNPDFIIAGRKLWIPPR